MATPAIVPLDAFGDGGSPTPPLERTPGDRVEEVDVASALTRCGLPDTPWSLNPYVGCTHGCRYCYVPTIMHEDQGDWGAWIKVKRNLPRRLAREVRRRAPGLVFLSSATDPYQPAEGRYRLTRRCLEVLARVDWPLRVLTRSPLVLRDLDVLDRFGDVKVGLSVPTLDDGFRRVLEPGAPPVEGRLQALRELADAGVRTYASLAPTYPLTEGWTPERVAARVAATGVGYVFFGPWRYTEKTEPEVRERLRGTPYVGVAHEVYDDEASARRIRRLSEAFQAHGVEVGLPDGG